MPLHSSPYGVNDDDVVKLPTILASSMSISVKSTPRLPYTPSNFSVGSTGTDSDAVTSSLLDVILNFFSPPTCDYCDKGAGELLMNGWPAQQFHPYRSKKRVLIIGPGFGLERTPRQSEVVIEAGYQIKWVCDVGNPEEFCFSMDQNLPTICDAIDSFRPHLVVAASKGGHYLMALWQSGLWTGPSLMLNAHPNLVSLPEDVPIVVAVGCNDEIYSRSRDDLENLISTGTPGKCFLYYTDNGGMIQGRYTRFGDKHEMDSLLVCDCLPRLMDAAMSSLGPEIHLMQSWRERIAPARQAAEDWLGCNPQDLRLNWESEDQEGYDDEVLFEVFGDSEEFHVVQAIFHAEPREVSAYGGQTPAVAASRIERIQRIENGWQMTGSVEPFYATIQKCLEEQGVAFEPGVHARWVFHGTDAIDSIITNPVSGFQPLTSGARTGGLWGSGSYFARDASYVINGRYCQPDANGVTQMLMCLLVTGISCLGDPRHKGVLPFRQKPHRYNSSVDSLSNPEVFVVQHPSAVYPAYLITLA